MNFNSEEFNVLVQAGQYYKFAATLLLAMGLVFQVPVAILAATRAGIVTPRQLRHNRRYAILVCAVGRARFLPGDAVTLLLETVPLYLLYEASILLASVLDRSKADPPRSAVVRSGGPGAQGGGPAGAGGPSGAPSPPSEDERGRPSVQEMIDHVDRELQG